MHVEYDVIDQLAAAEIRYKLDEIEAGGPEQLGLYKVWLAEMMARLPTTPAMVSEIIEILPRITKLFKESQKL